jgi:hypothetical protein
MSTDRQTRAPNSATVVCTSFKEIAIRCCDEDTFEITSFVLGVKTPAATAWVPPPPRPTAVSRNQLQWRAWSRSFYQAVLAPGIMQQGVEQWMAISQLLDPCQGPINTRRASSVSQSWAIKRTEWLWVVTEVNNGVYDQVSETELEAALKYRWNRETESLVFCIQVSCCNRSDSKSNETEVKNN